MPPRFVDTNVLLRYFTGDDEEKALRAPALLQRIELGEERIETSHLVFFEVIFTFEASPTTHAIDSDMPGAETLEAAAHGKGGRPSIDRVPGRGFCPGCSWRCR